MATMHKHLKIFHRVTVLFRQSYTNPITGNTVGHLSFPCADTEIDNGSYCFLQAYDEITGNFDNTMIPMDVVQTVTVVPYGLEEQEAVNEIWENFIQRYSYLSN